MIANNLQKSASVSRIFCNPAIIGIWRFLLFTLCNCVVCSVERQVLPGWDGQIRMVCHQVNTIVDKINGLCGDWAVASMDAQMSH